jgi:hypothetical protein
MTSSGLQYNMLIGVPVAPSATDSLDHTGSASVPKLIDKHLHDAVRHLNASHQRCVSQRTTASEFVSQPYAGIADHIRRISGILSQLTSALTQDALRKDADNYVLAQNQGLVPMFGPYEAHDKHFLELQHLHNITIQYESSLHQTSQLKGPAVIGPLGQDALFVEKERRSLPGPASPVSIQSYSSVASPTAVLASPEARNRLPNHAQARASHEATNPVLSDKDQFANYNLDPWKRRGKDGKNYCPRGLECKKGGVVDGKLVLFERNSAYIQHCNKHKRPFVCQLEGCPNPVQRRNFARADGLRRHQELVSHGVPFGNEMNSTRQRGQRSSTGSQEPRGPGSRSYLKPEYDFSDPATESDREDTQSIKMDTG